MRVYTVHWHLDVEAETPREAATTARAVVRNPTDPRAYVFLVGIHDGDSVEVDLSIPE